MSWKKLGLLFCPNGQYPWMASHAAVPFAEHVNCDLFRIYFSSRDQANRSHTGWILIDLREPSRVLDLSPTPVLSPGELGCFDDSGAMASWIARQGSTRYLYYVGWNLGVTVPFRNSVGLAISADGGHFRRYAPGPILDRTAQEPHFVASCCVLRDGDNWRMWYLSCVGWRLVAGLAQHRYHIKHAESSDGISWRRDGRIAIDFKEPSEYAISRPSVVHDPDRWRMWYSHRGEAYRIGYAESENGTEWMRRDTTGGLDASGTGWDSEMVEYPHVFDHAGGRYMLYNGNSFGKTGLGLAVWAPR